MQESVTWQTIGPFSPLFPQHVQQSRGLVLGGDDAVQNRYPYFTRIDLPDRFEVCGGTLIASDMVLTNPSCNM
jgi:hypothetical protein